MLKFNHDFSSRFRILKGGKVSLVVNAMALGTTISFAAPSGGTVTSGTANISQNANVTNINQSTSKASINWQNFSIASGETVNFNQPNVNSITLNRVIGNEKSIINGALNANGQVWLLNSNGVLFGKNASVNTAGILATTAELSDSDFNAGNYNFKNSSSNSVINEGTIEIKNNGSVILASNEVKNAGTIKAIKGKVHLVGADYYSLNLNGNSLVTLTVDKGVLDSLVENSGTIIANGGEIYLTTNAVDELLKGVVNNTGIIEANSLDGVTGYVEVFAHGGTANVDGSIEAIDGFVETSGDIVKVDDNFKVAADKWLIDPNDFTIASSGGDMTGTTLSTNLATADVEIQSAYGATDGNGDIFVNDTITWDSDKILTLKADKDIYINKEITATNAAGKLGLFYGQGAVASNNTANYYVNAPINLQAGQNFTTKLGSGGTTVDWTVITSLGVEGDTSTELGLSGNEMTLQGINTALSTISYRLIGNYVLGANIDASDTSNWNVGDHDDNVSTDNEAMGFNPIGYSPTLYTGRFTGKFDGLGHTVSNLYINRPDHHYTGLFGYARNAIIKNIGVTNVNIKGAFKVGGLVGFNEGGTITNSYSTGVLSARASGVGGLVGFNEGGTITNSYSTGDVVAGTYDLGGLVGENSGTITNSYSTGDVSGIDNVGGLVGLNFGTITNSYSTGDVTGLISKVGGLVGKNDNETINGTINGTITNSFWDIDTSGQTTSAGGTGIYSSKEGSVNAFKKTTYTGFDFTNTWFMIDGDTRPMLRSEYSTTITNPHQLQLMAMDLTADYTLANNIDLSATEDNASDVWNTAKGFDPIGDNNTKFTGIFDGLNHTISNLYINRPDEYNVGLFSYLSTGIIKNIGVTDVNITGNQESTGALAGNNTNTGTITNSYSTGVVSGAKYVGGLVGNNNNGIITNSYSTVAVTGTSFYAGGLVGENTNNGTITNSYSTGAVSGYTDYVGGLVANNDNGGTITNSFYDATINSFGMSDTAYGKRTALMQIASTYNDATASTWSVTNDSTLNSSYKYPVLVTEDGITSWRIYNPPTPVSFSLSEILTGSYTYSSNELLLNSLWTTADIFAGTTYDTWSLGTEYTFSYDGNTVTSFTNAGTYSNIGVNILKDGFSLATSGNAVGKLVIDKANLVVSGLTASNKTYDTTTTATLGGTASITALGSDDVTIGGTAVGAFANKNVGNSKAVTITGNTISGTDASNYNLVQQTGLSANITKADLVVSGLTTSNKTYDATTTATLAGTAAITKLGSDDVTLGGTAAGAFANKNVGTSKAVTITGNTISGADALNYNLVQQTGLSADITAKEINYNFGNEVEAGNSNGSEYLLSDLFQTSTLFGDDSSLISNDDYEFIYNGNAVTGFEDADTYTPISLRFLNNNFALGDTSIDGTVIINNNVSLDNIITAIANNTTVKVNDPKIDTFVKPKLFVQTKNNKPAKRMTQEELQTIQNTPETRIPLEKGSIVNLVGGGISLPEGISQEYFIANNEEGTK